MLPRMVTKSISQGGSFTDDMASVGMKAGSQLIEYKVYKATDVPEVAEYLALADDELIHYFVRLRTGDGEPIALSDTYTVSYTHLFSAADQGKEIGVVISPASGRIVRQASLSDNLVLDLMIHR